MKIMMNEQIKKLEKALASMRMNHKASWDIYGSELCSGEMIKEEEKLEKKIEQLKSSLNKEDPRYIIDD